MRIKAWVNFPFKECPQVATSFIIPDEVLAIIPEDAREYYIKQTAEDVIGNLVYDIPKDFGWEIESCGD